MKTWIAIIVVAVLALAFYSATETDERPRPLRTGGARTVTVAASRSADRPGLPVGSLGLAREGLPAKITRNDPAPESSVPESAKPPPSLAEVRDRFETFFSAELVDLAWSREAADALTRSIQAVLPAGSSLRHIECRGTLCRIETGHLDVDGFRAFAQHAFLDHETRVGRSGFFASLLGEPTSGGAVTAVAYLAREGKELPGPEALFATP